VLAPVVTPFKSDLAPDSRRFIAHCKWLLSQNCVLARVRHQQRGELNPGLSEDYVFDDFEFALDLLAIISYPRVAISPARYVG
jgi:hypothetical protein